MTTIEANETSHLPTYNVEALMESRQERGKFVPQTIFTLQKNLGGLYRDLAPQDEIRPLSQGTMRYTDGKATWGFVEIDGTVGRIDEATGEPERVRFTDHAYRQLAEKVLGSGGLKFIERQRTSGETGVKMATINWMERLTHADKACLFRTIQLPGHDFRTVRGVLSGSFTTNLDHLDVVGLLAEHEEFSQLPIISWKVTADSMRIRGLLNPADSFLFDENGRPTDPELVRARIPVPMFEIGNGEIGNQSVSLRSGAYTYACLNGMGGWGDTSFTQRWNHVGGDTKAEKVQGAIGDALKSARVVSAGIVDRFRDATQVAVDDAFALLEAWGSKAGHITAKQARRATLGAMDATSYPGRNLANVVSGITLAAQDESSIQDQRHMEAFASRLMERGLRAGDATGAIVIPTA